MQFQCQQLYSTDKIVIDRTGSIYQTPSHTRAYNRVRPYHWIQVQENIWHHSIYRNRHCQINDAIYIHITDGQIDLFRSIFPRSSFFVKFLNYSGTYQYRNTNNFCLFVYRLFVEKRIHETYWKWCQWRNEEFFAQSSFPHESSKFTKLNAVCSEV